MSPVHNVAEIKDKITSQSYTHTSSSLWNDSNHTHRCLSEASVQRVAVWQCAACGSAQRVAVCSVAVCSVQRVAVCSVWQCGSVQRVAVCSVWQCAVCSVASCPWREVPVTSSTNTLSPWCPHAPQAAHLQPIMAQPVYGVAASMDLLF
jgi:hypothetical protein